MTVLQPTILYTEDASPLYDVIVPAMEILLNARVTHTTSNGDAEQWFREGQRFDAYVLDDSARTGGGHGVSLSMEIAKTLAQERRGGIVISACSSNADILSGSNRYPFTLDNLHEQSIEFWYKHTELFTMLAWLGSCFREKRIITREEWLLSVGEQTRYVTFGEGSNVEKKLMFLARSLEETQRGAYLEIAMSDFFQMIREGSYADDALKELLSLGNHGKET